jgi:hypothetical protein
MARGGKGSSRHETKPRQPAPVYVDMILFSLRLPGFTFFPPTKMSSTKNAIDFIDDLKTIDKSWNWKANEWITCGRKLDCTNAPDAFPPDVEKTLPASSLSPAGFFYQQQTTEV